MYVVLKQTLGPEVYGGNGQTTTELQEAKLYKLSLGRDAKGNTTSEITIDPPLPETLTGDWDLVSVEVRLA